MSSGALRAAWEAAQQQPSQPSGSGLRAAWEAAQRPHGHDIHAEYASGRLAKRMARENANDAEAAALDEPSSGLAAFGRSLAATGANIAQGIPGMEAAEAGARALVRRQPYREALSDIRGETSKIPTALRVGEKVAGSIPLAGILPGSAAASGAIIGGADQALSADPDQSMTGRAVRTGLGTVGGALAGKATDAVVTGARAMLPAMFGGAEKPAALLLRKQAERAASAKDLYAAAAAEGKAHEATPAIRQFLSDPDIQDIVTGLQQTDQFANVSPESYDMLDAIYKTLSDQAKQAQKGLDALSPTKANQGRFRLSDIKGKQQKLLRAMGAPGASVVQETQTIPAMTTAQSPRPDTRTALGNFRDMFTVAAKRGEGTPQQQMARRALERHSAESSIEPIRGGAGPHELTTERIQYAPAVAPTYERAVQDYAKRSAEIDAIQRGYEALRSSLSNSLPTAKNLTRKTPEAFAEWAVKASPVEVAGAREGILGGLKMAAPRRLSINPLRGFGVPNALSAVGNASDLLRSAATPEQQWIDALQNLGLLTAGNATSP